MGKDRFVIVDILSTDFMFEVKRKSDGKEVKFSDEALVEIAAVKIENGRIIENFSTFMGVDGLDIDDICEDWDPDHFGITPYHLKGAPDCESVAKKLHCFVRDSIIIPDTIDSQEGWKKFAVKALSCGYCFNNSCVNMSDIMLAKRVKGAAEKNGKNFNEFTLLEMANYVKSTKNIAEIMADYNVFYPPYDSTDRMVVRNDCLSRAIAFARLFIAMAGDEIVSLKEYSEDEDGCPF